MEFVRKWDDSPTVKEAQYEFLISDVAGIHPWRLNSRIFRGDWQRRSRFMNSYIPGRSILITTKCLKSSNIMYDIFDDLLQACNRI
jgi:hypothetical protein